MGLKYTFHDIVSAYQRAGVSKGSTVLIKTDLRFLGSYEAHAPEDCLKAHFQALAEIIDLEKGTLVVSTSSTALCNTSTPFDPATTPSERGAFTNFLRLQPNAIRSFHPFLSYTAIGKNAEFICKQNSRHGYGVNSPKDRMVKLNTLVLSVGLIPEKTCSTVHHAEFISGVPYRYTKEFFHPVVRDQKINHDNFYMYVWYRNMDFSRNKNRKIFDHFISRGHKVNQTELGRSFVYSYFMSEFLDSTIDLMMNDIYGWLDEPPQIRPYRN